MAAIVTQPITSRQVVTLDTAADWDDWFNILKTRSEGLRVWRFVNPESSDEPPSEPQPPTVSQLRAEARTIIELTSEEQSLYRFMWDEYRTNDAQFTRITSSITDITTYIYSTVARRHLVLLDGANPKKALQTLKARLSPTDLSREREVSRLYLLARRGPQRQKVETWLEVWESAYNEAKKLNVPEVAGARAVYDFLEAVRNTDSGWSQSMRTWMNMKQSRKGKQYVCPDVLEIVEQYRNHRREEQVMNARGERSAFSATLNDETAVSKYDGSREERTTT